MLLEMVKLQRIPTHTVCFAHAVNSQIDAERLLFSHRAQLSTSVEYCRAKYSLLNKSIIQFSITITQVLLEMVRLQLIPTHVLHMQQTVISMQRERQFLSHRVQQSVSVEHCEAMYSLLNKSIIRFSLNITQVLLEMVTLQLIPAHMVCTCRSQLDRCRETTAFTQSRMVSAEYCKAIY